jgi:hypothetical protein
LTANLLQLAEILDSSRAAASRAPGQQPCSWKAPGRGGNAAGRQLPRGRRRSARDGDGETRSGLGTTTMRPAAKGWRRRGCGRGHGDGAALGGDGDGAALLDAMATVRSSRRRRRRFGELSGLGRGCPLPLLLSRPCYWATIHAKEKAECLDSAAPLDASGR